MKTRRFSVGAKRWLVAALVLGTLLAAPAWHWAMLLPCAIIGWFLAIIVPTFWLARRRSLWLKLVIVLCLPIVITIGYAFVLGVYWSAFADLGEIGSMRKCYNKPGFFQRLHCGISETYEDTVPYLRSLPSDEEMIAHFNTHRQDFERLLDIYRGNLSVPKPEVQVIMDRINVTSVEGDNLLWIPPDPYSQTADFLKEKARLKFEWYSAESRRFSGVIFYYRHSRVMRPKYMEPVAKGYKYFPCAPKVRDGVLIEPAHLLGGYPLAAATLNTYPPGFAARDSAYREIDEHWFIWMRQYRY